MAGRLVGDVGGGGGLVEDLAEGQRDHHGDGEEDARAGDQHGVAEPDEEESDADDGERGTIAQGVGGGQFEEEEEEGLRFPLLSDADLTLTAALRLPTFRAAGVSRLKRLTLVVDRERTVRQVQYPVTDIEASVRTALETVRRLG